MNEVTLWSDLLRTVVTIFDRAAFGLLKEVYLLFFNVSTAEIVDGAFIAKFFARIQLIIGVFMMFQLAITILKGIMNPDSFTDSKTGAGNLISRIVISLVLLTLLVPINIASPSNEYEKQINNNGLLFGTLYSLQHRILSQNTLGRLIMGSEAENYTAVSDDDTTTEGLTTSSNRFASTILRTFFTFNVKNAGDDPTVADNRVCETIDDNVFNTYTNPDIAPNYLIDLVNEKCSVGGVAGVGATQYYVFAIDHPFIGAIVASVLVWLILAMTFEVAVRAIKLAVLRLIAPVPIISYMDPKGGKDSAFSSWLKLLGSTYLDLFIKLVTIYFVMNIVSQMMVDGIAINGDGFLQGLTWCIIWIGLFIFAKDADKFVKQALGLKDNGGKFFSAFGQAMGFGATAAGAIGSTAAGYRSSKLADETRESFGEKDIFGNKVRANSGFNRAKHLLAGLAGGVGGVATGATATMGAKDHYAKAAWDAMQKRNATALARGNDGSTLFGRARSTLSSAFTGEGAAGAMDRSIATLEAKQKALSEIKNRVSGEMVKQDWTYGTGGNGFVGTDLTSGTNVSLDTSKFNHKSFMAAIAEANAGGRDYIEVRDHAGRNLRISMSDADKMKGTVLKFNEDDYIRKATHATFTAEDGHVYTDKYDQELVDLITDAEMKGAASSQYNTITDDNGRVTYTRAVADHITTRDDYTKVSEQMGREARQQRRRNTINKANDQYSGNKK